MVGDEVFFLREDDRRKRPSVCFYDWTTKRMLHLEPIKEALTSSQPIRYKTTFAHLTFPAHFTPFGVVHCTFHSELICSILV